VIHRQRLRRPLCPITGAFFESGGVHQVAHCTSAVQEKVTASMRDGMLADFTREEIRSFVLNSKRALYLVLNSSILLFFFGYH
jgi:hypothetical protein